MFFSFGSLVLQNARKQSRIPSKSFRCRLIPPNKIKNSEFSHGLFHAAFTEYPQRPRVYRLAKRLHSLL